MLPGAYFPLLPHKICIYRLGIAQQCIVLDSKIGTQSVATVLNAKVHSKTLLKSI